MDNFRKSGKMLSVNWQDGMLIKSSHFNEQEDYFENLVRWAIRNTALYYGLTRSPELSGQTFEIRIDHDGENWVAVLSRCFAITPGGKIIQIDGEHENSIKTAPIVPGGGDKIPVYIYVTGAKVSAGSPGETDMPTRYPYRSYEYRLIAGELIDIDPADCLKVGEVVFEHDRPQFSTDYIPPCSILGAHPTLSDYCFRLKGILTQVRQSALHGFQAFVAASQGEGAKFGPEHRLLQEIMAGLSIKLGAMLKVHPRPDLPIPPYQLFSYYQDIFATVDSMLETYSEAASIMRKKYANNALYNRFISGMTGFNNSKYNHQELGQMLKTLIILMNDFVEFVNLTAALAGVLPKKGKLLIYRQKEYNLHAFGGITTKPERDGLTIRIEGLNNIVTRDLIATIRKDLFGGADYRYIMVKIGLNENDTPGRMDPVFVDAETSPESLIFKPMDDLKSQSLDAININLRGNFNAQALTELDAEKMAVYVY